MSTQEPPRLGICPSCKTDVATFDVLIEYEDSNGQPQVWADCPGCGEVVRPE